MQHISIRWEPWPGEKTYLNNVDVNATIEVIHMLHFLNTSLQRPLRNSWPLNPNGWLSMIYGFVADVDIAISSLRVIDISGRCINWLRKSELTPASEPSLKVWGSRCRLGDGRGRSMVSMPAYSTSGLNSSPDWSEKHSQWSRWTLKGLTLRINGLSLIQAWITWGLR